MLNPAKRMIGGALLVCSFQPVPFFAKQSKKDTVSIRFVAQSVAIRSAGSDNEDVYLVKVYPAGDQTGFYAKLVDTYRDFAPALPLRIVTSESPVHLRAARDSQCDVLFAEMHLRSAPGDLIAIIPTTIDYETTETKSISPGTKLPCFRTVGKRVF